MIKIGLRKKPREQRLAKEKPNQDDQENRPWQLEKKKKPGEESKIMTSENRLK
jgi:hypothetical protein